MTNNLILACLFIGLTLLMALYRAVVGPSKGDRLNCNKCYWDKNACPHGCDFINT